MSSIRQGRGDRLLPQWSELAPNLRTLSSPFQHHTLPESLTLQPQHRLSDQHRSPATHQCITQGKNTEVVKWYRECFVEIDSAQMALLYSVSL